MSDTEATGLRAKLNRTKNQAMQLPGAALLIMCFRVLRAGIRDMLQGELQVRAASLVYSTLLALVPLIAVSFSVLKGFGVQNQLRGWMGQLFESVGSDQEAIVDQIITFVDNMDVGVLGGVGLAILFYTVFSLIRKIETAVNYCWRTYHGRSFGEGFLRYISIIIMGPVVVFAAMTMSVSITNEPLYQQLSGIPGLAILIDWGGQLLPYGMLVMVFTAIYYFLPNTYVRFRAALAGGLIAALLWFLFGMLFAQTVAGSSNYVAIYAAFATMIIFMLWLLLAWLILLFGASIAFYAQNPAFTSMALNHEESQISGQARERITLSIMRDIARQYAMGRTAPSIAALSDRLDIPIQSISWVIDIMMHGKVLTAIESSPPTYVPGRAAESIRVRDLLVMIRAAGHNADQRADQRADQMTERSHREGSINQLVNDLEDERGKTLGNMSLRDLANDNIDLPEQS
ncbi:MAG: YihY/virulence factor BrkB family protein [Alphaproteobacteria bacterium]|nr:MAG: YihY/virulence factor BrkB family protein [Alphaproteobacteria bacterium]